MHTWPTSTYTQRALDCRSRASTINRIMQVVVRSPLPSCSTNYASGKEIQGDVLRKSCRHWYATKLQSDFLLKAGGALGGTSLSICKKFCLNVVVWCFHLISSLPTPPRPTHTHKTRMLSEWHIYLTNELFGWRKHSKQNISINQNAHEIMNSGYLKFPVKFCLKTLMSYTLTQFIYLK